MSLDPVIPSIDFSSFSFEKKQISRDEYEDTPSAGGYKLSQSHYAAIGQFMVEFSALESGIAEWHIPQLLGNRFEGKSFNYKIGHSIVAKIPAIDRFTLFIELCLSQAVDMEVMHIKVIKTQLNLLRKMLTCVEEARNIVAHADWSEHTKDYWFVTKLKHNKTTGSYDYVMHRLSDNDLRNATKYVEKVSSDLCHMLECIRI